MLERLKKRIQVRDDQGFTLIELMVVVLIIGILMAIAIPTFLGAQKSAQDRAAQSNVRNALTNEIAYFSSNQVFAPGAATGTTFPDPNLQTVAAAPSTPTSGIVVVALAPPTQVAGQATGVCLWSYSASGNYYGVYQLSGASSGNGSYFYSSTGSSAAAPTCPATAVAPTGTSWIAPGAPGAW